MRILDGLDALPRGLPFAIVVGVFDGVHRGHEAVLAALGRAASQAGATPVVMTFRPHPQAVLRGSAPPLLCDPSERLARLERAGAGMVVVQPFDAAFAAQSPEAFIRRVREGRELRALLMTAGSALGRDRLGTIERMRSIAAKEGFDLVGVPPLEVAGRRISSSRIRAEIRSGRLAVARRLLGRHHAVIGEVVHGDRRGMTLGYPTANLRFTEPVALPPDGVFAVRVQWGGPDPLAPVHRRDGVASLGVRPTFGGGDRTLEAHLFDFDGDLYGQRLRVEFIRRQRGEKRFSSAKSLVIQMDRDAGRARRILGA